MIPVRLPPGRARLATRPSLTGSSLTANTMGMVVVAALAANAAEGPAASDDYDLSANQFGRQRRQPIVLTLRPAVFDRNVLALDIAGLLQALSKSAQTVREASGMGVRNPITGIAGCCARAASGQPPPHRRAA